jgi:hypothetical protein
MSLIVADTYARWQWKCVSRKHSIGADTSVSRSVGLSVSSCAEDAFQSKGLVVCLFNQILIFCLPFSGCDVSVEGLCVEVDGWTGLSVDLLDI